MANHRRFDANGEMILRQQYEAGKDLQKLAADYSTTHITVRRSIVRAGGRILSRKESSNKYETRLGKSKSGRLFPVKDDFFSRMDNEGAAWLLGLITADGCITSRYFRIQIALNETDRECLEKVKDLIGFSGPITHTSGWKYNSLLKDWRWQDTATLSWSSPQMRQDLARLGIGPRKSLTVKAWPVPDHLARHYFRGLIDGDGWLTVRRELRKDGCPSGLEIGLCGTLSVVEAFDRFIYANLGIGGRIARNKTIWRVTLLHRELTQKLATLLYGDAVHFMARKKAVADRMIGYIYATPPTFMERYASVMPLLHSLKKDGRFDSDIADYLNAQGPQNPSGKPWLTYLIKRLRHLERSA